MGKAASEPIPFAGSQLGATRHVCAFFRNADEEYRVLLPFIQDGFESGDRVGVSGELVPQAGGQVEADLHGRPSPDVGIGTCTRTSLHEDPGEAPEEDRLNPGRRADQRRRPRSLTWAFTHSLVAGAGFEPATFGL